MKRGRIVMTPEYLGELLGMPGCRLIGPADENGRLVLTVEHDSLPDVAIAENQDAPLITPPQVVTFAVDEVLAR